MHHNSHLHVLWTTPTSFNSLLCPKKTAIPNPNLWLSTAKRPGEAKSLPLQRCEPTDDVQPNHSPSPRTPWRYRGVGSQEAASMSIFHSPPQKIYIYFFWGGVNFWNLVGQHFVGMAFFRGKEVDPMENLFRPSCIKGKANTMTYKNSQKKHENCQRNLRKFDSCEFVEINASQEFFSGGSPKLQGL